MNWRRKSVEQCMALAEKKGLRRSLGPASLVMLGIGCIIGAGLFALTGIVAYYASAPTAETELAQPFSAPVRAELAPLITPTLALMRGWRRAKQVRRGHLHGVRYA